MPSPVWSLVTLGAYQVWHATVSMPNAARQANWTDPAGTSHRVPLWTHTAPLFDSAQHWVESVLNPGNLHTRWGLWSTTTDLYVIPPIDGSWTDPNTARVRVASALFAIGVSGPDFSMAGPFTVAGHNQGIRVGGTAARMHVNGVTFRNNTSGIDVFADLPATYSHDHLIENCRFEDDLTSLAEGEAFIPHHHASWNIVKASLGFGINDAAGKPILVSRALTGIESVGFRSEGGSINTVVSKCAFDGMFDAASHYQNPGRYDLRSDGNLLITDCTLTNIVDDCFDRAGYQDHVTIQNIVAHNVGVVISPAPLWGTVTFKNIKASLIGGAVRVPDGTGAKPHGSIVKYGTADISSPHGTVNIEDSIFWTTDPTTQGLCPDGGDGNNVPTINITRSTLRVGGIVLNWGSNYPHPPEYLTLTDTTLATSGPVPLKTNLKNIATTPVAQVDARYYAPAAGNFAPAAQVEAVKSELRTIRAREAVLMGLLGEWGAADAA